MPTRLTPAERLARAEERWRKAAAAYERARQARHEALVQAHEDGLDLGEIGRIAGTSHEAVRRIIRATDGRTRPYRRKAESVGS